MKVILTDDVAGHGVAGEIIDVAPGFARNYLMPQGYAIRATAGALRQMKELRETAAARRAALENEMEALAVQIESIVLEFPVRAGSSGRLYGSVTTADIAEALEERLGVEIDHRQVGERPLRELGEYDVPVRLAIGQSARVKVFLYPEGELSPSEKAAQEAEEAAREEEEAENMAAEADAEATQSEIEQYYEAEEEEEEFLIE